MKICNIQVNHLDKPIGYDLSYLTLSWKIEDFIGTKTTKSRVIIAKDESFSNVVYDSKEQTDIPSNAYHININLEARTRYYVQVEVYSDKDEYAKEVSYFETSKLNEPWEAKWISCDSNDRHPIFFKDFKLAKKVKDARLYISGLGLYYASINNQLVSNEYFAPYSNNYNSFIQYQTYDVTNLLDTTNKLEVILGNGWFKGRFGFSANPKPFYGDNYYLIAELHITYEDGSKETINTDESFKVKLSNITFSNFYDGEHRDDNLEEKYIDVKLIDAPKGKLVNRFSSPVLAHETIKPIELITTKKNEKVFDLGQNFAGIFKLHLNVKKGTVVTIKTGEILQDGCFYNANLRTAKSEYIYTSNGKEVDLIPMFTYYGYRYVLVEGVDNLKLEDFTGIALYTSMNQIGTLKTGNEKINKLISNTLWGLKSNFIDVPTDCPQRDERMGWTADTQVFTKTALYLEDAYAFYRKFLYDMASEQASRNGAVPVVVPAFDQNTTSSVWSDATCIIPTILYEMYGDISILKEHYPSMKAWCDYLIKMDKDGKNWGQSFHFGDWLALDVPNSTNDSTESATDKDFIAYVYFYQSLLQTANAASLIGNNTDANYYHNEAYSIKKYLNDDFYTSTGKCAINTQTAQILTLKHHLSNNEEIVKQKLIKLLDQNNGKLNTGFVGAPLFCPVLSDNNFDADAYRLLLNEQYPGWLYCVNLGATTIWERWNSVLPDGKISGTGMNSLNHYSYGSITEWMYAYMAGIRQDTNSVGFKNIIINPRISNKIHKVEASYNCIYGTIKVNWGIIDEFKLALDIEIPFDTTAKLIINNKLVQELKPGKTNLVYESETSFYSYLTVDSTFKELFDDPAVANYIYATYGDAANMLKSSPKGTVRGFITKYHTYIGLKNMDEANAYLEKINDEIIKLSKNNIGG